MSASCLDLRSAISAPPQLDSDRMDADPGGLGMALEEELAILTGERDEDVEVSASETPVSGQDSNLLALYRQKEKDLVLAAKLGKALLERNQDLTKQYEQMTKDLNDKLEVSQAYMECVQK